MKKYKKYYIVCVLTWSLLGVKKDWVTPRSVSFRGLVQNFRRASPPLSYAESPPSRTYTFTYTVKPRFTDTRLLRKPRWYKHFVWPPQCPYKRLLTVSHYSVGVFLSPTLTKQNIPDQDEWFNTKYSWPHAIIEHTMYVGRLK